ncbi:hypothetical protein Y032_0038g3615 [Ancylostoma ceylanicum]|uniref:Uncharacterized protein n=1 Tax=Ancylostoma ceylanicum TaxID=53326 RepID=A0A016UJS9_9BILA|nr:hypothetical protein Y032_0038g3615 [Ancylostoma ceylanicum]
MTSTGFLVRTQSKTSSPFSSRRREKPLGAGPGLPVAGRGTSPQAKLTARDTSPMHSYSILRLLLVLLAAVCVFAGGFPLGSHHVVDILRQTHGGFVMGPVV